MKIASYDIHPANYTKKRPETLKKIADLLLLVTLVVTLIDPLINSIPDFEGKNWLIWGWTAFSVIFKFVSKMVTEKV